MRINRPDRIGKTTTIAKLAKRHIAKYGPESVGIISTDYFDITAKNQILYYGNLMAWMWSMLIMLMN